MEALPPRTLLPQIRSTRGAGEGPSIGQSFLALFGRLVDVQLDAIEPFGEFFQHTSRHLPQLDCASTMHRHLCRFGLLGGLLEQPLAVGQGLLGLVELGRLDFDLGLQPNELRAAQEEEGGDPAAVSVLGLSSLSPPRRAPGNPLPEPSLRLA